jgi:phosphoglycerate dehydrogenase-like enzyme
VSVLKVAVLDDSQEVAQGAVDWSVLEPRAEVTFLRDPMLDEDEAARVLAPFHAIIPMRERTPLPGSLIRRLPNLRLVALTGARSPSLDIAACTAHGVLVCNTGINTGAATAELAFTLLLNCARSIPLADATMRRGGWHAGIPIGDALSGKRLGILGLGKLGSRVAGFGKAFGMEVVAWSQNLTAEAAAGQGVTRVEKDELFATSDAISIHLVLSDRSRGLVGERELGMMKRGAILVNTSRGPIVEEAALVNALREGRITAGLDVFDQEPLPEDHPLRTFPNAVLTPHLGYSTMPVFRQFYGESIENILAFLNGNPIRVMNEEALDAALAER